MVASFDYPQMEPGSICVDKPIFSCKCWNVVVVQTGTSTKTRVACLLDGAWPWSMGVGRPSVELEFRIFVLI